MGRCKYPLRYSNLGHRLPHLSRRPDQQRRLPCRIAWKTLFLPPRYIRGTSLPSAEASMHGKYSLRSEVTAGLLHPSIPCRYHCSVASLPGNWRYSALLIYQAPFNMYFPCALLVFRGSSLRRKVSDERMTCCVYHAMPFGHRGLPFLMWVSTKSRNRCFAVIAFFESKCSVPL